MKKFKLLIVFVLGVLLGGMVFLVNAQYRALHQPFIQEGKVNIQGLIQSIGQVVAPGGGSLSNSSFQRFEAVYQVLKEEYYDQEKLNTGVMLENAVKAFVDGIGDPYTVYMDSTQNSGFQEELKGQTDFEGIGAVVSKKEYYVLVEEVLKASPAYLAGILPLDRIVMIGSGATKDLDVNQAVALIRGPKGSTVKLTIERVKKNGTKEIIEKTVTRDKLSVPSVTSQIFTGQKKIGYINISIIGEETENLMKNAVAEMKGAKVQGIILDLRGNGGGLLPIASEIVSHFLPKNKLVVTAKYKTFEDEEYLSRGYNDLTGLPVIVLVDGMTASAGEIIAMALQEQMGAKLVGTQTFGKGSIQTMDEFTDGASLKYTIGKWYSPTGKNIDKVGVTPDVLIPFDADLYAKDKTDNQLQKAKDLLTQ
ncbi:MAG: S41 family peptidase [candidate division SR1 bacterium]|nr:S41 family peptidase [candidate division SR1 bacterium]